MVYDAKFIVKGSSRAKIYSVFKYVNFGSLTAPEAFIMLFGNGIPLQRVIPMLHHIIKLKYPSGAKWEPFLHIFAVWLKNDLKLNTSIFGCYWEFNKALKDHITPTKYLFKLRRGQMGAVFTSPIFV